MASSQVESRANRAAIGPTQLAVAFITIVVALVVIGVVLRVLSLAWDPLVRWIADGATITAFVQRVLVEWPQSWNWPASLAWAKPTARAVDVLTPVLGWVLVIFGFMLPMVTYQIYALRKVIGFMQSRVGPTQVGPIGLLQTPADVLKLLTKEDVIPRRADRAVFTIAPFIVLVPASMAYLVLPFGNEAPGRYSLSPADLNIGVLYLSAISSVAVIGIIAAGWSSANKYSLLGAMRSAAQLVTYEVPLSLAVLAPVVCAGSLSLQEIVRHQEHVGLWFLWPSLLGGVLYGVAALAELGHIPFDLPEAESELVSGYNTEYSGMKFAMFFLAEFSNAFVLSAVFVTLFLGGWQSPFPDTWPVLGWDHGVFAMGWFFAKTLALVFGLFWLRATLPRVRIDQLMAVGWKLLIPLGVLNLLLVAVLRVALGG